MKRDSPDWEFKWDLDEPVIDDNALEEEVFGSKREEFIAEESKPQNEAEPAWIDEDDKNHVIGAKQTQKLRRLTKNHQITEGMPLAQVLRESKRLRAPKIHSWADIQESVESDNELDLLQSTVSLVDSDSKSLVIPQDHLSVSRAKNVILETESQKPIVSMEFHKEGRLLMIAGGDKQIHIHEVDGKNNTRRQGVTLEDLPVRCAAFSSNGKEIMISGEAKHFYVWDLVRSEVVKVPGIRGRSEDALNQFSISPDNQTICFSGENGYALLVSQDSKQLMGRLKMNDQIASTSFSHDGTSLWCTTYRGEVYEWDVRTRKCMNHFPDEGTIHGSSIATGSTGNWLATGSDSGVVNLYSQGSTKPSKTFMNLTTSVNSLCFNHDDQILAIASSYKRDALRLVHVPSKSVFQAFPGPTEPLARVHAMAFSPNSGYFSVGNSQGKVLLYRLNHYQQS